MLPRELETFTKNENDCQEINRKVNTNSYAGGG